MVFKGNFLRRKEENFNDDEFLFFVGNSFCYDDFNEIFLVFCLVN